MKNSINDIIEERCEILLDASTLSEEEYAMARRQGLGASDASIYLGLQAKWRNETDLIANKCATMYTKEEQEVSQKPAVRKGKDLEPLILSKFEEQTGIVCFKPKYMYRLREFPYLTINFDGISPLGESLIPVEAKFTSTYGDKYWNYNKTPRRSDPAPDFTKTSIVAHCDEAFEHYGVPAYYYAQVQQQMLGLGSDIGVVVSLRDLDWNIYPFWIFRDDWLQKQIIAEGYRVWQRIERQRKYTGG
jgi:hypothetical protein